MNTATFDSCPRCGGYPELDDEGRVFTCYFCCDRGVVESHVAAAHYRAEADYVEQFAPTRLGVVLRVMQHAYDWDDEELSEPTPGSGLFTRLIPKPRYVRAAVTCDGSDDIPF